MSNKKPSLQTKIELALCDPNAPWYGSDLVEWVADLIQENKELKDAIRQIQEYPIG